MPGGTGRPAPSSTYARVLAMGPPIGGAPAAPGTTSPQVATTLFSVGP